MIDAAAAGFGVKELADFAEVLIFLPPHDALVAVSGFEKFLLSFFGCEVEIARNAGGVFVFHFDDGVGAAIAWAFQAVIFRFLRHLLSRLLDRRFVCALVLSDNPTGGCGVQGVGFFVNSTVGK